MAQGSRDVSTYDTTLGTSVVRRCASAAATATDGWRNLDRQLARPEPVAAHHDLHIRSDGTVLVLTEAPRRITVDHGRFTVLDNAVTLPDGGDGHLVEQGSRTPPRSAPGSRLPTSAAE